MQRLCATLMMSLFIVSLATPSPGDIPPNPNGGDLPTLVNPKPPAPPEIGAKLRVTLDFEREKSLLVVPENLLGDGNAQKSSSLSNPRMMVAGLAMSLAIGAVFFLRRSQKINTTTLAVLIGSLSLGMASVVWANVPPPHNPPSPPPLSVGDISLEVKVVPKGDKIQLILCERDMGKFTSENPPELSPPPPGADPLGPPGTGAKPGSTKSAPPASQPKP